MKIRTVLMAIVATSALSTAAFATPNAHSTNHPSSREQMSDRCSALESQFDSITAGKLNTKADGLYAQGVDACNTNNSDVGVQKLEHAVRDLGVKPAA